ncbi:methyltransferase-like protein 27 [Antedon mediterranea]|uniref:methyltransferase-like protein 27 n=1 Tax=Antedon mediterranea TaxID=105859 RepID=UPI003AF8182A
MSFPEGLISWQKEYKDINRDTLCDLYDNHAHVFDKMMGSFQDEGHKMTVITMNELIPNKASRLLDFTACTGLLGVQMQKAGYTNIDAFDGSQKCIEECKSRKVYTNFMVEFVGEGPLNIANDTYDAVVCNGGFARHHLPLSVLREWIRIVKPGGYIINTFRNMWLTDEPMYNEGKFEKEVESLEKEGKWKFISKQLTDPELYDKCFIKYVHEVV